MCWVFIKLDLPFVQPHSLTCSRLASSSSFAFEQIEPPLRPNGRLLMGFAYCLPCCELSPSFLLSFDSINQLGQMSSIVDFQWSTTLKQFQNALGQLIDGH